MTRSLLWPDPTQPWNARLGDFRGAGYRGGQEPPVDVMPLSAEAHAPLSTTRGQGPHGGAYGWSWGGAVKELRGQTEQGFANLEVRFEPYAYEGHHKERGRNAFALRDCSDCWAVNLRAVNVEFGLDLNTCARCTVDLVVDNSAVQGASVSGYGSGLTGHHGGVYLRRCVDCLIRVRLNTKTVHDVSLAKDSHGNVIWIEGPDVSLDFHGANPHHNLIVLGNVGAGTRVWKSGGPDADMPHSGPGNVFWNLRRANGSALTSLPAFGASGRVFHPDFVCVGHSTTRTGLTHVEAIVPTELDPQDLHLAQRGEVSPPPPNPPEEPMPKFAIGDAVQATAQVNVRASPGTNQPLVGVQPTGSRATVLDGPQPASGFIYWQLNFAGDTDGWVGEDKLIKVVGLTARQRAEQFLIGLGMDAEAAASL